ncbi:MAG: hypothetical protein KAH32_06490 [Chlamydiia bacterium]|nr:hypothetical protein [Chlamydiia bacterium]
MMRNISESLRSLLHKGSKIPNKRIAAAIICAILVVYAAIKSAIPRRIINKLNDLANEADKGKGYTTYVLTKNEENLPSSDRSDVSSDDTDSSPNEDRYNSDTPQSNTRRSRSTRDSRKDSTRTDRTEHLGKEDRYDTEDLNFYNIYPTGTYKFPDGDDDFRGNIRSIALSEEEMSIEDRKLYKINNVFTQFASALVRVFSFNAFNQDFQAFYGNKPSAKKLLNEEISASLEAQKYIKNKSLKNIHVVEKMLLGSTKSDSKKTILVRKSPDMEADKAARDSGLIKDRKKCKEAAKSLAKLAGNSIFRIPDPDAGVKYPGMIKIYKDMRDKFSSQNSVDVQQSGFTAEELLGKDCFTVSKNAQGDAEVDVMLVSIPADCISSVRFYATPTEAFILNYALAITAFPYNAKDMIDTIVQEKKHPLTNEDKDFLLAVAESAKKRV